jgi:hypothetical protein
MPIGNFSYYQKTNAALGLTAMLSMLALSLYFAFERVLNTDNSNFFFLLINNESINVAENRFSVYVPQFPTWLAVKLKVSLNALVYIFSASYTTLYLLIFCLICFIYKLPQIALALVLALLLGVNQSFYHPVTETHQAIAYALLFYAGLKSNFKMPLFVLVQTIVFLLAIFSHPVAVFLLAFSWLWHMVETNNFKKLSHWAGIVVLGIFSVLRSKLNQNNYDAEQYQNMYKATANIDQIFNFNSVRFLLERPNLYLLPLLLLLFVTALFLFYKKWIAAMVTFAAPIALTLIAILTFYEGNSQMMMEKAFMPSFAMLAICGSSIPFSSQIFKGIYLAFLAVCIATALIGINTAGHKDFRSRLNKLNAFIYLVKHSNTQKYLCRLDDTPDILKNNWWATSADVLVLSTVKHNKPITLYLYSPNEDIMYANQPDAFLYVNWWRNWQTSNLNANYFILPNKPYKTINLNTYE